MATSGLQRSVYLAVILVSLVALAVFTYNKKTARRATANHHAKPSKNNDNTVAVSSGRSNAVKANNENCVAGHVKGYFPICGNDGCLTELTGEGFKPLDNVFDANRMAVVRKAEGWCAVEFHAPFAYDISVMQWQHGIYGSVGEIGVYKGRYSSILAAVTHTPAGERFFAADIFEMKTALSEEQGRLGEFLNAMKAAGFTKDSTEPASKLHLFAQSSVYLSKMTFINQRLPSFRLLSIDGGHLRPIVLSDFEKAACIVRQGGIIVFDDALYKPKPEVRQGIEDFFKMYGSDAFKPLAVSYNKLFVCSSDYHATYMDYIRKNLAQKHGLKETDEKVFVGNGLRYFEGSHIS